MLAPPADEGMVALGLREVDALAVGGGFEHAHHNLHDVPAFDAVGFVIAVFVQRPDPLLGKPVVVQVGRAVGVVVVGGLFLQGLPIAVLLVGEDSAASGATKSRGCAT